MAMLGCVVKKDSAASAAVSAEIAKQLAKSLAGGATGTSANIQGTTAAVTPTCTGTTTIVCKSDGIEMSITLGSSTTSGNTTTQSLSGYQKMTGYKVDAGGSSYSLSGTLNIAGNLSVTISSSGSNYSYTAATTQNMNGKIDVVGANSFDVEYKNFSAVVTVSGSTTGSYSTSFSCGGKLVVDTIEYPVKSDCSI